RPQVVQLHGAYPLEHIPMLRDAFPTVKIIKAVHVNGEGSIAAAVKAARYADAVLLDTKTATRIGGTGVTHDWSLSRRVRRVVAAAAALLVVELLYRVSSPMSCAPQSGFWGCFFAGSLLRRVVGDTARTTALVALLLPLA